MPNRPIRETLEATRVDLGPGDLKLKRPGPGAKRWICPYWSCHQGSASTAVSVVNAGHTEVTIKVVFRDENGAPIAAHTVGATRGPNESFFTRTDDRGVLEPQAGWFEVIANEPVLAYAHVDDIAVYGPKDNRGGNAVRWSLPLYPADE